MRARLDTLWQISGCQNQQLLERMRRTIDVVSDLEQVASNEKCKGAVQQFKSMMKDTL